MGLCPLGSGGEGSFVTVKLDPPPFLGGVPLSWYTGVSNQVEPSSQRVLAMQFLV